MADRRLQWQQVDAPDFSAASAAMARAGQSFSSGMDAAQGLIGKYAEAQTEKANNDLLAEIAGLPDEESFYKFVQGGGLAGRNIDKDMRDMVMGMVPQYAETEGVKARTANTRATMGINQAREARTAADWKDGIRQRDALRGLAGDAVAAQEFARQNGDTVGGVNHNLNLSTRELVARTLMAEAGGEGLQGMMDVASVIRNRAASGRYGEGIDGVILQPGQFSAWNKYTGYANGEQGQDMGSMTPSEEAYAAADAMLSGNYQDQTGGATHYVNMNVSQPSWFNDSFKRRGNHWFGDADGVGAVQGNTGPVAGANVDGSINLSYETASPVQAYQQALIEQGLFTPAEINQQMASITTAGEKRSEELDKQNDELLKETAVIANQELLADPEVVTRQALVDKVMSDTRFTPSENEARLSQLDAMISANPNRLAPTGPEDEMAQLDAIIGNTLAQETAALNSTDQNRAIGDIERYQEDPFKALASDLNLGNDGESPGGLGGLLGMESGFDENKLRNMINDVARENNVEPALAAVAMRDAFERDPFGRNTLANRFDREDIAETIKQLSQERITDYRRERTSIELRDTQRKSIRNQIALLKTQLRKAKTPAQKAAIEAQILSQESLLGQVGGLDK